MALALLGNTLPTGAILVVLIMIFGPVSGAHFNPAVSLVFALRGDARRWRDAAPYVAVQIVGAVSPARGSRMPCSSCRSCRSSTTVRTGSGQWLAEAVATFGLLLTIFGCVARAPRSRAYAVGLYITAAYWFTASTSFANPAVTIARALSDTFAGIAPSDVPAFVAAQLLGMLGAIAIGRHLWRTRGQHHPEKSRYALRHKGGRTWDQSTIGEFHAARC